MSQTLTARFRIVTPMFLGGTEKGGVELPRGASVKGALRFWWRALNWARLLEEHKDEAKALQALYAEEADLFGAASGAKGGRQSRILLKVEAGKDIERGKPEGNKTPTGLPYLLGQGLYHFREQYLRQALLSGHFIVRIRFHPKSSEEQRQQVADALLIWGCLGGMGSRMRRGLGSVAIEELEGRQREAPANIEELKALLGELLPSQGGMPPLSAFSGHSRVDISLQGQDPWSLLGKAGAELQLYRSWGRDGRVNGRSAERNFKDDHDLAQQAAEGKAVKDLPKRAVFGFPHNYFFSSTKKKVDMAPGGEHRARRASPLWIHAHQFPDGSAAIVQTLLRAQFLPEGEPVHLKFKPRDKPIVVNWEEADWGVVHSYLDRFSARESVRQLQGGQA